MQINQVIDPNLRISGIRFSEQSNICNMILNSGQKNTLVTKNEDINLNDLAVALLVYCDKNIECKNISFSLDPAVPSNPEGPFQKKVVWPDNEAKRALIAGTQFSEIMFEADWIMK
jgi:hypothetical protein